jgi:alkanesulfonate monooxygenase SsuD/methylene tetrahydromethanopterin reductase-like flavin-dependent oxidoreductase (luciferase family)
MTRRGLFVPPFDALSEPSVCAELARDAEAAGWDGFFVWDHLLYSEPVRAIADPWIVCAAVALATERIQFGPMVTPLSRRRTQVLARQAVSLDRLSQGRLVLGFGLGDDGPMGELSSFGDETDARTRARLLDEGLDLLRGLLTGEPVDRPGLARTVQFLPTPARPGGIPIWVGGRYPNLAPLRRAARHNGAFVISIPAPEDLATVRAVLADARPSGMTPPEVIIEVAAGEDPMPWVAAGATWVLTRIGPYEIDLEKVRRAVRDGP